MKFRGLLETFQEIEAESEEEAAKKMAAELARKLLAGEVVLTVWINEKDRNSSRCKHGVWSADHCWRCGEITYG